MFIKKSWLLITPDSTNLMKDVGHISMMKRLDIDIENKYQSSDKSGLEISYR